MKAEGWQFAPAADVASSSIRTAQEEQLARALYQGTKQQAENNVGTLPIFAHGGLTPRHPKHDDSVSVVQ